MDDSGNLYEKIANGGRRYLSGPQQGLNSYSDSQGKWYSITSGGKRVYF